MNTNNIFLGEKIHHEILGKGTIVNCYSNYIVIQFDLDEEGKTRSFQFPDIFTGNKILMAFDSKEVNDYIRNEIETNNGSICCSCTNGVTLVKCKDCSKMYDPNECVIDDDGQFQCKDCYNKLHFICPICGETRLIENSIISPFIKDGKPICEFCAENRFIQCSSCKLWVPEEKVTSVGCLSLCPSCTKEQVTVCSECGALSVKNDSSTRNLCYDCESKYLYLDYISTLDICGMKSNSFSFDNFRNMRTVKIMSKLRHGYGDFPTDKTHAPFDVLFLCTYIGELVIIWKMPERFKNLCQYGCTLTELKKNGIWHLAHGQTCIVKRIVHLPNKKYFNIWESPYQLRAQTVTDMDYGDRWEGLDLIHEGNKYGDTSSFYIIGYIDN